MEIQVTKTENKNGSFNYIVEGQVVISNSKRKNVNAIVISKDEAVNSEYKAATVGKYIEKIAEEVSILNNPNNKFSHGTTYYTGVVKH